MSRASFSSSGRRRLASALAWGGLLFTISRAHAGESGAWNQWHDSGASGIGQDQIKLSTGMHLGVKSGAYPISLAGAIEYRLRDYVGIAGATALPIHASGGYPKVIPLMIGIQLHLFPKRPFDIHVAGRGGFALISPASGDQESRGIEAVSRTELAAGASFYFWGAFHFGVEGAYAVCRRSDPGPHQNLSGPSVGFMLGGYL